MSTAHDMLELVDRELRRSNQDEVNLPDIINKFRFITTFYIESWFSKGEI